MIEIKHTKPTTAAMTINPRLAPPSVFPPLKPKATNRPATTKSAAFSNISFETTFQSFRLSVFLSILNPSNEKEHFEKEEAVLEVKIRSRQSVASGNCLCGGGHPTSL